MIHEDCLRKLFFLEILITNTLVIDVYKMFKCGKNQMHYNNVQSFKR